MEEHAAPMPGDNPVPPPPPVMPPPYAQSPPPPLPPPPVLTSPYGGRPPKKGGRGWMIFAIILLVLLLISFMSNISNFARAAMGSKGHHPRTIGPKLEEVLTEDNDAGNKIAVVEVNGIISSGTREQGAFSLVEVIKAQLKAAEDDDKVKAVILKVDSPGGEVLASDEIYRELSDFQKKSNKPVVASMGNLAASGGYYISAPCRWIVANELTITGSIGVIMHGWNYRGLMDKVGLLPEVYKSGKFKDMMSGEREPDKIPPEERKMMQHMIDETYGRFKTVVAQGRGQAATSNKGEGKPLASDWADYADGRVLSGKEALELGFVDELGNFQDAIKRAQKIAGISKANLIEYQQHYDFSDIFRLLGKSETPVIKVDLGMDAPKLQTGQLYFISPTFAR